MSELETLQRVETVAQLQMRLRKSVKRPITSGDVTALRIPGSPGKGGGGPTIHEAIMLYESGWVWDKDAKTARRAVGNEVGRALFQLINEDRTLGAYKVRPRTDALAHWDEYQVNKTLYDDLMETFKPHFSRLFGEDCEVGPSLKNGLFVVRIDLKNAGDVLLNLVSCLPPADDDESESAAAVRETIDDESDDGDESDENE